MKDISLTFWVGLAVFAATSFIKTPGIRVGCYAVSAILAIPGFVVRKKRDILASAMLLFLSCLYGGSHYYHNIHKINLEMKESQNNTSEHIP